MNKNILGLISLVLGTAATSLALTDSPASAATLIKAGSNEAVFTTTYAITRIGEVEGNAGGLGKELFFGFNGAGTGVQNSKDLTWSDARQFNWNLTWNPTTNQAQFTVVNPVSGLPPVLNYTFASTTLDRFNAFGLLAKANAPSSRLSEGTTIDLKVNSVSFSDSTSQTLSDAYVSATSTVGSPEIINKLFYVLSSEDRDVGTEITAMSGTFSLDWTTINPQRQNANSRMSFELVMYDPPAAIAPSLTESTSVPEPTSIIGLLSLGAIAPLKSKVEGRKSKV
jgi:hypothetical protein